MDTRKFGLIGKDISYSFSKAYFTQKFKDLQLSEYTYRNFDIPRIEDFVEVIRSTTHLKGLNVTIPYKEQVIPYLDELDPDAKAIGAVNTIKIENDQLIGYNTDAYGFENTIKPHLKPHHSSALILGTGGASKAIQFIFEKLGIVWTAVSRQPTKDQLGYQQVNASALQSHTVLVNCTPLGTHPNITQKPNIEYEALGENHLLFDLIYNPEKTAFLQHGKQQGATIVNGHRMLQLQADRAWDIWQK